MAPADQTLRPYQQEAVQAIGAGLRQAGARGQIHAACGTGKTLVGLHGARRLLPGKGLVVIACPSLALIAQTLGVWAGEQPPEQVLAVCSDEGVGDSLTRSGDLGCTVSCDTEEVAAWLRSHRTGRRLVVTTHLSAPVLGQALRAGGGTADLLIVDEAHRTAGRIDKLGAVLHDDARLPAQRRLYMTATPRYLSAGVTGGGEVALLGMDDELVFGPVLYTYPFGQAIADGWLDDYQVAVIGIRAADALRTLQQTGNDAVLGVQDTPLRMAVIHTALAQAAREWDLRRIIVFTPRVADAHDFAISLPRTLRLLGDDAIAPKRELTSGWVSGQMSMRQREARMRSLSAPPHDGWSVLANARCLSEGVDVPAVDGIVFTHPKRSTVDVVQAVGRALRRNPDGSGVSTIVVPILLPDEPDPALDRDGEWRVLWQVVRALRAHDTVLGAELDAQAQYDGGPSSQPELPSRILLRMPDGHDTEHYLRHVTVKLVDNTTTLWAMALDEAKRYVQQYGHLNVPTDYHAPSGLPLGHWLMVTRGRYRSGNLSAHVAAELSRLGINWQPLAERRWWQMAELAAEYYAEHGHLRMPVRHVTPDGKPLGEWVKRMRAEADQLSDEQRAALDAAGMDWDLVTEQRWQAGMAAYLRWCGENPGMRPVWSSVTSDGYAVGAWIRQQRRRWREGSLTPEKIRALEKAGIDWTPSRSTRRPMPADVMGVEEVADILGIRPGTITAYVSSSRPGGRFAGRPFPPPDGRISYRLYWRRDREEEIRAWRGEDR